MSFQASKLPACTKLAKTPKLNPKRPRPAPSPEVSRRKVGLSPAPLTSAPSRGLGTGGFRRVISIQSWFWKGHPGFATPSAMVVNCIQEQWSPIDLALQCTGPIHYKKNGWGFFLLSRSVGFLFFLHKFAQPSFTRAWSKARSTARLAPTGPFLPGNGKELGKHPGRRIPLPPAHWESSAQGCRSGPSTEQALSRRFLESIDDNPCHQCPHHCCLFSSSPAPSRRLFPTFLASVPARRLSTHREHPPSAACLGLPRKLQPSHSKPLGTDHLGLSLG